MDKKALEEMNENFGPYVHRGQISWALGGSPTKETIANLDARGEGPEGKVYNGRKAVYPKHCAIDWICNRLNLGQKNNIVIPKTKGE